MMALVYILIGIVAVFVWFWWAGDTLCPRCGTELTKEFGAPWQRSNRCSCGWRTGERP
ncbi:MAG: hypothetical protein H0V17_09930 [Deltaproteobacteria bacterium]|nr:hypothetical protein [Deltaproteobacteria bacterium]